MFLAGIQKKSLDARLHGYDGWISDTHCVAMYLVMKLILACGFTLRRLAPESTRAPHYPRKRS
jgi:hypothetical protein